jgi:hypothetical protein
MDPAGESVAVMALYGMKISTERQPRDAGEATLASWELIRDGRC